MADREDRYRKRNSPVDVYERRRANGRARSRSPSNVDRYQPQERNVREDHFRQRDDSHRRRGSPPPTQAGIDRYVPGHEAPMITANPMPNPINLDYQVGFTFFAEWWRIEQQVKDEKERLKTGGRRDIRLKGEKEAKEERVKQRDQIQAAYDAYKERLQSQMARLFVLQHRNDEWFKERYVPQVSHEIRLRLAVQRRIAFQKWLTELENGVFDEFTLEGIYKNESNGAGGIVEKEEGEATAANEVLGVGDLVPSRGGDIRDDAANQPTLLIKTIAPTVSRAKMEDFCRQHLGEEEGGFQWLSLSDPNAQKKFHRIGWVMLSSTSSEGIKVEGFRGDGLDEEDAEEALAKHENGTSSSVAARALAEINGKTIKDESRGDFTCHVGIHEPPGAPRKKALWDLFSSPERIERDLELALRITRRYDAELGQGCDGAAMIEEQVANLKAKGWLQPPVSVMPPSRVNNEDDMEADEEGVIEEGDEQAAYEDEIDDEELLAKKKTLDLVVEYLRRVHNFCLFCVFESDSVHELIRKCPGGHLRRPRASLTTSAKATAKASASGQAFPFKKADGNEKDKEAPNGFPVEIEKPRMSIKTQQQLQRAFNWVKTYEDKLLQILEPENINIAKLGGRGLETAIDEDLHKHVKQEDENKWRCKVPECTKLFKGYNFWRKHVEKRHEDFYDKIKQDIDLVNAYVLDPSHIAPSRSDSSSNGHFPPGGHGQQGTPRGFSFSNMQQFSMGGMPGSAMPGPMQMAALLAQMNGSVNSFGGVEDDRHGVGPMRRGIKFNNRAPGPYDRPNKDQRYQRWSGAGGRLSPPRNAGLRQGGPARFADGQGGSSREAVQGRSLKSYEDLDAAGGSGIGDLDY